MRLIYALLISALALTACTKPKSASAPTELKLLVDFPANPERADIPIPFPLGPTTKIITRCVYEGATFTVILDSPIPAPAHNDRATAYRIAKEIFLEQSGSKLILDEPITTGGISGRRQVFAHEGVSRIEQRLFIIDDSLYTVAVGAPWDIDLDEASRSFFDSIKTK